MDHASPARACTGPPRARVHTHPRAPPNPPQDHGTIGQLFFQQVTTGVGLKGVAKTLGEAQIERSGVSPSHWMGQFGRAVNAGAGARGGLPLGLPDERLPWFWRVAVEQLQIQGLPPG